MTRSAGRQSRQDLTVGEVFRLESILAVIKEIISPKSDYSCQVHLNRVCNIIILLVITQTPGSNFHLNRDNIVSDHSCQAPTFT